MFSVGFFFTSLGIVIFLFVLKTHERESGIYFEEVRRTLDHKTYVALIWIFRELSPDALWGNVKRVGAWAAHHIARFMARAAKVLENRARHVAHRTSHHRVKKQPHYLESVIEEERARRGSTPRSIQDTSISSM